MKNIDHYRVSSQRIKDMNTASKVSKYGVISGLYFPAFGLNTEKYRVSLLIQSECGKIRTRKKLRIRTLVTQWKIIGTSINFVSFIEDTEMNQYFSNELSMQTWSILNLYGFSQQLKGCSQLENSEAATYGKIFSLKDLT